MKSVTEAFILVVNSTSENSNTFKIEHSLRAFCFATMDWIPTYITGQLSDKPHS